MNSVTCRIAAVAVILALAAATGAHAQAQPARLLDVEFRAAPLDMALHTIARAAAANLAIQGEVHGVVTMHLRRVTFEQALRGLSAAYNLDWRVVSEIYVVRQRAAPPGGLVHMVAPQSPVEMRVYQLRHARAEDLAETLQAVLRQQGGGQAGGQARQSPAQSPAAAGQSPPAPPQPPAGPASPGEAAGAPVFEARIAADASTNSLVVVAPLSVHFHIQAVLRTLDVPAAAQTRTLSGDSRADAPGAAGERISRDAIAYRLRYADPAKVKQILEAHLGERQDVRIAIDQRTRSVVVTGPARVQQEVARLILVLDQPVPHVVMTTRVVELTETAARRLGIDWTWQPADFAVRVTPEAVRFTLQLLGMIRASIEEGMGRILASPTVAAQDGQEATVNVGTVLHVPVTRIEGGREVTTMQRVDAGIRLDVTPRVVGPRSAVAELNIQANSLAGISPQGFPIVTQRSVQTRLELHDGQTVVLGGLISDETTELMRRVPLLGDIPIIGELFRFREVTRRYSNIVVMITPAIVMPQAERGD
jgi:type II secretory pathway component GspD/PulD (secretin)